MNKCNNCDCGEMQYSRCDCICHDIKLFTVKKEEAEYLEGFMRQFKEELSDENWTVSSFLEWLNINKYKIIKK